MRRTSLRWSVLAVALAALSARAAHDPFERGFDTVPVKPTPALNSGIALEGASAWPARSYAAALVFDYTLHPLALREGRTLLGHLISYRVDAHLLFAYQLHERIDLGIDLPLVLAQGSGFGLLDDTFPQSGVYSLFQGCGELLRRGCGFADIRVVPRGVLLDPRSFPIGLALIPEVRIPVGDQQSFTGDLGFTFAPRLALEAPLGPLRVLGNLGYRFRRHGQFLNLYAGNELTLGAGLVYRLGDFGTVRNVDLMAETHLATPTEAPFTFAQADSLKSPWSVLLGGRAKVYDGWGVQLAVGRGVTAQGGYGRESLRVLAGVRYEFEYRDRDGDGIPDDEDACPDVPEDKDGFEDSDGCPDPDNDQDGVPDTEDACPDEPGLKELDGCPDRDQDEVPDSVDKCPDEAGPPENEGCPFKDPPFVIVEPDRLRLRANVLFETASARIQRQSYPILDEVATVLEANPELGPITIEGHTDNRGAKAYNQDLSDRRAKSVRQYLIKKGIDAGRLRSKGYGLERPIAPNDNPLGRARNRRVEFMITKDEVEIPAQGTQGTPSPVPLPAPPPGGTK